MLTNYYRNYTVQQVRDDLVNKLFYSLIMVWLVWVAISYLSPTEEVHADDTIVSEDIVQDIHLDEEKKLDIWGTREYNQISFIVIHHTATRDDLTAEQMELSMRRTYIHNRGGRVIPTHYIIDKWGNLQRVNPINTVVWATLNEVANLQGVHIELVWDFNKNKPTDDQYNTLNSLISKIEDEVGSHLLIKWHGDFQPKNCPWINFDFTRVVSKKPYVWQSVYFNKITAYYTPLPTDTKFSHWTFEKSVKVNGDSVNAMWWDYKDDHKYTHGACGRRWEFWTVFEIEWRGRVVCVDRWSAIHNEAFDIWYGQGEVALSEIYGGKIHPQQAKIKVIHLPL